MKQMKFLFILFLTLILSACATATPDKYRAKLQNFIDKPESELIEKLGVPSKTYESGGNKYLTYASSRYILLDRDFGITMTCTTTFTITNDIVKKYSFEGNDCKSN